MFRMWAKIWKENRLVRDMVVCNDDPKETRTQKVFSALDKVCMDFDLSKPIWLDSTVIEFKKHSRARFTQDNFIDSIDFDFLEIRMIEED